MANNWYVITGGTSTGKSTLVNELAKMGYRTLPEIARLLIDQAIENGMTIEDFRKDEEKFNYDIARKKQQYEQRLDSNEIVFLDRGMHDTLAYMRYYNYEVTPWLAGVMRDTQYKKVFILEPLPYKGDYGRPEGEDFSKAMHKLHGDIYAEYNMEPIIIPAVSPRERAELVLRHITAGK